jgi:transaldolase
MALFLNSASIQDAQQAAELGFVWGATTDPLLMAQAGREPADVVADLCELLSGAVFYQLTASTLAEREAEAHRIFEIAPAQVGLNIPCSTEDLGL